MLSSLHAQLIVSGDLLNPETFQGLLERLEGDETLQPKFWGAAPGIRDPYDRQAILQHLAHFGPEHRAPHLLRYDGFSYDAVWYSEEEVLSSFQLETRPPFVAENVPHACEALSQLVSSLPLEFGTVDLRFAEQDKSTRMYRGGSFHHLRSYAEKGPSLMFARNYFGTRLIRMMGGDTALRATGCPMRTLANGVVEIDLLDKPWDADARSLKDAQSYVLAVLRSAGIFTQETGRYSEAPGLKWQPLLGSRAAHKDTGSPFN